MLRRAFGIATLVALIVGCSGRTPDQGECPAYLACASTIDGQPTATLEAQYGDEGICWDGTADEQVICRAACTDGLSALADAGYSCGSDSDTDDDVDPPDGDWGFDEGCQGETAGTGYRVGDTAYDFSALNQNGEVTHLYDFCGRAVVVVIGAMWDAGTTQEMDQALSWYETYQDDGLVVLVVLSENEQSSTPDVNDLAAWASQYSLTFPVLADDFTIYEQFRGDGIPVLSLLGPGAELLIVNGDVGTRDIENALP